MEKAGLLIEEINSEAGLVLLDWYLLKEACLNKPELIAKLLKLLVQQTPAWIQSLEESVREQDRKKIREICHTVKGATAAVHADACVEFVEKLKGIQLITDYLNKKQKELKYQNKKNEIDKTLLINGINLTNIGVFRKYLQTYIENHSGINKDMFIMVRQLAPTAQGLPLEIYAFSSDKRWANYEWIMSDIFDHAIAAVNFFDLEIYELQTVASSEN